MHRLSASSNIKSKCNNFKCGFQGRKSYIQGRTFSQFSICLGLFSSSVQVLLTLSLLITMQSKFLWRYEVLYVPLRSSLENSVKTQVSGSGFVLLFPLVSTHQFLVWGVFCWFASDVHRDFHFKEPCAVVLQRDMGRFSLSNQNNIKMKPKFKTCSISIFSINIKRFCPHPQLRL